MNEKTDGQQADEGRTDSEYPARHRYLDRDVPANYEADRFSGLLGRFRYRQEQRGVGAIVAQLSDELHILDCPCGIGRWWPLLARKADKITAMDISPAMLEAAETRIASVDAEISVLKEDAESIDLPDGTVDAAFSHALMKHLPVAVQRGVLTELSRVSRQWVICSFSILTPVSGLIWRRREFLDSNPVTPEQLRGMADAAGLGIVDMRRCSTPLGVEHSVLFRKTST